MKTTNFLTVLGAMLLAVLFCSSNAFATLDENDQKNEETIVGTVVETVSDTDGKVLAVAIEVKTDVETEEGETEMVPERYLVANNEAGDELKNLIGKQVEARGVITIDEDGAKTITVSKFVQTDPAEVPETPDETKTHEPGKPDIE